MSGRRITICLLQEANRAESFAGPPCLHQRWGERERETEPSDSEGHYCQGCAKGQVLETALGMAFPSTAWEARGPQTLAFVM